MDAIATLEGLNFAGVPAAAVSRGVGYIQAQQLVTYPRRGAGLAGPKATWMQSGVAGLRGLSGYSGNLSGFGAPEFAAKANPAATVETGRAVICQATTQAEVAKREAVALDKAAVVAAKQGEPEKAAMLGREADRKAEIAIAATEKAAKAAIVVEAAKQEAVLTKQAAVAQSRGDAPKVAVLVAAVQETRKQQAEVKAAPSVESMTCKCPGAPQKGGLSGFGFSLGGKVSASGADIKSRIEAKQGQIKDAAKAVAKAAEQKVNAAKSGFGGKLGGAVKKAIAAGDCPGCAPAPVQTASMLPGGVLPWLGGAVVLAFVAKRFMR